MGREPSGYRAISDSISSGSLENFDILQNPTLTRLYNALKFSGRTSNNLGIGIFNAIARSERARLRNTINGKDSSVNHQKAYQLATYLCSTRHLKTAPILH